MKNTATIAVVGATGLVGGEMINCLIERKVPYRELKLLASKDSAGEVYEVAGNELLIEELTESSFEGVTHALFATSAELSEKYAPIAVEAGARVIDNSSRFRMEQGIPLVVPEVNGETVGDAKIIANPNCSTIQLVPVLKVIDQLYGVERVVVSTYQSVSGAGKAALDELWAQTLAVCNQRGIEKEAFQHQIAFNCIPQIDVFRDDGYTKEEMKIIQESRKILGLPNLRITATAVRVPVFHSHAESVNVETKRPVDLKILEEAMRKHEIVLYPDGEYPMQLDVAGQDPVHVGRLRLDPSVENGVNLWIVADNVRKGAALNAVQILERLLEHLG